MTSQFVCPICGYPDLDEPPRLSSGGGSYEICSSCGFEFGVTDDDLGETYSSWRAKWVARGMPWDAGEDDQCPDDWDPAAQLARLLDSGQQLE